MNAFVYEIIIFVTFVIVTLAILFQKHIFILKSHQLFITETSTRIYGKMSDKIEKFMRDETGSYYTCSDTNRIYAYRKAKKIIGDFYYVSYDRILFNEKEMYMINIAEKLIKSNNGINKFKL